MNGPPDTRNHRAVLTNTELPSRDVFEAWVKWQVPRDEPLSLSAARQLIMAPGITETEYVDKQCKVVASFCDKTSAVEKG